MIIVTIILTVVLVIGKLAFNAKHIDEKIPEHNYNKAPVIF